MTNQAFTDVNRTGLRAIEMTGEPGDVYLGYSRLFHSPLEESIIARCHLYYD
ncbi:MAG: hypothetical protein ABI210_01475 [Abditibacteriaceae bacterium]